ncbi:wd40 domain-containing protein [Vairimorpha apis BRL 01]|uniref:Wd40 domain-containing protein n=1 Tax=Vairimorpha apis BRL 01 TaxID=1037528 RepID=T0L2T4_9MICR|nr:wd40 domain-containing protein [Vairimorpha apis BRL 01]
MENFENLSDEEYENLDEIERVTYIPTCLNDEQLECIEEAYVFIDYYSLDWPSQTIDSYLGNSIVVATNPEKDDPKLIKLDIDNFNKSDFIALQSNIITSYNRLRTYENIYCVGDSIFDVYNSSFENLYSVKFEENLGYGLCLDKEKAFFSTISGDLHIFTDRIVNSLKLHDNSIECMCVHDNLIFSCSTDKSMKITDLRSNSLIYTTKQNCDINSIDFNKDNLCAFGDDNGIITLIDIRVPDSKISINWHKSSISMIKWKDSDVFCSSSDEQICIFDITLEDDWEYEKYLLFVHQGQKYYKDFCFNNVDNDMIISTSIDGLCFFKPISLLE